MGALNCCCAKYSEKTAVPQSSSDTTCPIRITRSGDHCALLETPWSLLELASSCCMPAAAVSKSSGRSSISSSSERLIHAHAIQAMARWRERVFFVLEEAKCFVYCLSLSSGGFCTRILCWIIKSKNVLVWHPLVSVSLCVCMCVCTLTHLTHLTPQTSPRIAYCVSVVGLTVLPSIQIYSKQHAPLKLRLRTASSGGL